MRYPVIFCITVVTLSWAGCKQENAVPPTDPENNGPVRKLGTSGDSTRTRNRIEVDRQESGQPGAATEEEQSVRRKQKLKARRLKKVRQQAEAERERKAREDLEENARIESEASREEERKQLLTAAQEKERKDAMIMAAQVSELKKALMKAYQKEESRRAVQAEEVDRLATQEAQRRAVQLEEQRRAAQLEDQRRAAQLEEQRRAIEEQRRAAQLEEQRRALEAQQRAAQLEEQRRAIEEQRRAAQLEEQRRALEAQQRVAQLEEQRRAMEARVGYPAVQRYSELLQEYRRAPPNMRAPEECPPNALVLGGARIERGAVMGRGSNSFVYSFGGYVVKTLGVPAPLIIPNLLMNEKAVVLSLMETGSQVAHMVQENGLSATCDARSFVSPFLGSNLWGQIDGSGGPTTVCY